jgi:hypothetical protein
MKIGGNKMKVNDMTNLWVGYSEEDDFRVLICALDLEEAQEIADEYLSDTHLEGAFVITEYEDVNTHFDCDYILV